MLSISDLLNVGATGLMAHKTRMAVAAHNVSNVSTPGYHRQRVLLQTQPSLDPEGSTQKFSEGCGVKIADIIRDYNIMMENTLRDQTSSSSGHATLAIALQDAQVLFAGDQDSNLGTRFSDFWNAWQDVANNSDSLAYRNILLQKTSAITEEFNNLSERLIDYRKDMLITAAETGGTGNVARDVEDVNSLAAKIAELNNKISTLSSRGNDVLDLMDERDNVVLELAGKVNFFMDREDNNTYTIYINGPTPDEASQQVLVQGNIANTIIITTHNPAKPFTLELTTSDGNSIEVVPVSGALGAWGKAATLYDQLTANLNKLAETFVLKVNELHRVGFDLNGEQNWNYFDPLKTTAGTITVSSDVNLHPERIAAAKTLNPAGGPNVGDGALALDIADLSTASVIDAITFNSYFTNMTTNLGSAIESESALANDGDTIITTLKSQLAAETGVNLDEEMVDMLSAQRAFQACSKVINAVDGMLDTIINRLG